MLENTYQLLCGGGCNNLKKLGWFELSNLTAFLNSFGTVFQVFSQQNVFLCYNQSGHQMVWFSDAFLSKPFEVQSGFLVFSIQIPTVYITFGTQ